MMSSTIMEHGKPVKICSIARWNTSDAELMPKGIRRKRYLPKGVAKVVRREDSWSNLICQNKAAVNFLFVNCTVVVNCISFTSTKTEFINMKRFLTAVCVCVSDLIDGLEISSFDADLHWT